MKTRNILEPNISNREDLYVPNIMHMYLVSVILKEKTTRKLQMRTKVHFEVAVIGTNNHNLVI